MSYINLQALYQQIKSSAPLQSGFAIVAQFLDDHPAWERIAYQIGTEDSFTPTYPVVGHWGFGVWRNTSASKTCDLFLGYSTSSVISPAGGTFYFSQENYNELGLGFAIAWHSSSAAWAGTTNNDGNDTFTTTNSPWKSGSIVLPALNSEVINNDNSFSGTWQSLSKSVLCTIANSNTSITTSLIISADNNSLYVGFTDETITKIVDYASIQQYIPVTSSYDLSYLMMSNNIPNNYVGIVGDGDYGRVNANNIQTAGGLTIQTVDANPRFNSSSYDMTIDFAYVFGYDYDTTLGFKNTAPRVSNRDSTWLFPFNIITPHQNRRYVGYSNHMFMAPGHNTFTRLDNDNWLIVGDNAEASANLIVSAAIPWTPNYTGSLPVSMTNQNTINGYIATGSVSGSLSFVTMSNLFDPIIIPGSGSQTLYRSLLAGEYYYGNNNPVLGGGQNTVVIIEFVT